MADLGVILALVILSAVCKAALARWKTARLAQHLRDGTTKKTDVCPRARPRFGSARDAESSLPDRRANQGSQVRPVGIDW